jgi:ankyrin repeat protein
MGPTKGISHKSPLMTLPNELFLEMAPHLKSFQDLNSLVGTSRFFHGIFNTHLYRRVFAADRKVLDGIVSWVLSEYRLASLTLLLDHGLSVNHTGSWFQCNPNMQGRFYQDTMLCFLCKLDPQERSVPLARLLIQRGANIRAKGGIYSDTALYRAIFHGNCPIVALLLEHGADANAAEAHGVLPLHFASDGVLLHLASNRGGGNNAEIFHLLIAHGADIEARSADGETPLTLASKRNPNLALQRNPNLALQRKSLVMAALLEHGADAGVHGKRGATPLHWASVWFESEHHELAKSLLDHGAIVNATDEDGRTPLHWLVEGRSGNELFMARFLLENGADASAVSNDGRSIMQCALSGECGRDAFALLVEHGADITMLNKKQRRRLRVWLK